MHGVLVHRGARPRESSPTMHRVLVHRGASPRESTLIMHRVLVHNGARPRARARARASRPQSWRQEIILGKIRFRGIKCILFLMGVSVWRGTNGNNFSSARRGSENCNFSMD